MYLGVFTKSMDPSWPPTTYNERVSQILVDTGKIVGDRSQIATTTGGYVNHPSTDAMDLEPTPLGPMGVRKVVSSIPLSEYSFPEEEIIESIFKLPDSRASEILLDAPRGEKRSRLSSSASEPSLKKYRSSTWQNIANTDNETNRLKQRASWTAPETMRNSEFLCSLQNMLPEGEDEENDEDCADRFRSYQSEHSVDRFADLVDFKAQTGHCFVPHNYAGNPSLAQWVKRQRYQYKLNQDGKHSTLTEQRQMQLEAMGFVWDSHKAIWEERYEVLRQFRMAHGHSNVPSNYAADKSLAIWVKCKFHRLQCGLLQYSLDLHSSLYCLLAFQSLFSLVALFSGQRRQNKLYQQGERSSMTEARIQKLDLLEFVWTPRKGAAALSKPATSSLTSS